MKYIRIEKDNLLNGPGIRTVLWLANCSHHCEKCHNPETWDPDATFNEFTDETKQELFNLLSKEHCAGLTLTGGDPLFPETRFDLLVLLNEIKTEFPNKSIWCWTGYTLEQLTDFENTSSIEYRILSNIDVLIDGRFNYRIRENDLKLSNSNEILKYRGSSNQRIIDVKKTLEEKRIIEYGKI